MEYNRFGSEVRVLKQPIRREIRSDTGPRVVEYVTRERSRPNYVAHSEPLHVIREAGMYPYVTSNGNVLPPRFVTNPLYNHDSRIIVENGHRYPSYLSDRNIAVSNGKFASPRYVTTSQETQPRILSALELDLYKRFKPVFDQHEPYGVPLRLLKEELKHEGITHYIPEDRLNRILYKADRNGDEQIDFAEFLKMMTTDVTPAERTAFQNLIAVAVADILPKRKREDFLANYNCYPPPFFMVLISLIQVIIFGVYAGELSKTDTPVTATSGVPTYSPLMYKPRRRYEAWRYITYMFIHQGYLHIIFNLVYQMVLGLPLELVHKFWRVMLIYVLGVLAGSLAHSVTDVNVALAGASGGCYAIIGAHIASIILNWKEMNYQCTEGSWIRIMCSAPIRLTVLLSLAISDTGLAIYRRYFDDNVINVGISAHIGGFLGGLLLGIPILKNVNVLVWEKPLGYATLSIYLAFVVFAIIFNCVYKLYPETDWSSCCPS